MERTHTVDSGKPQTDPYSDNIIPMPPEGMLVRSAKIKKIQTTAMLLLFLAAIINFLDRSSLSVANSTIREEMGLSGTEIGLLLSAFSLAYGIAQLPCGPLLDRKGPRLMLGIGMFVWSLFQTLSGMIHNFTQFIWVRIGLGIGEAPMNPCGVKVINDWFNIKDRGMPMGIFNAASTIGLAISPPILTAMMLAFGWRGMFITIGVLGIALSIGWYMLYRNRQDVSLSAQEQAYLNAGSVSARPEPMNFREWRGLFKNRTMWGMMIGFSGINYTAWLYLAWLPGYLQTTYHLDLKSTGLIECHPLPVWRRRYVVERFRHRLFGSAWNGTAEKPQNLHCGRHAAVRFLYRRGCPGYHHLQRGVVDRHGAVLYPLCRHLLLGPDPRGGNLSHDGLRRQHSKLRQLYLRLVRAGGHRLDPRYHPLFQPGAHPLFLLHPDRCTVVYLRG